MSNLARIAFMLTVVAPLLAGAQTARQPKAAPQAASQPPAAASRATAVSAAQPAPQPITVAKPAAVPIPLPVRPAVLQPVAVSPAPEIPTSQPLHSPSGGMPAAVPGTGSVTPAAVDYASGKLTVVAQNAPLGLVLNMIAAKTGGVIDLAPELQNEPVVARLGPTSVREVLTELLDSPRIDYIVLGGSDEGDRLQRVVVRLRHSMGLFAMAPSRVQPRPQGPAEELGANGHPISGGKTEAEPQITQQQRMANWQRTRESMRLAEIKQQAQERENEANGSPDPPPIPQENQPPDPPQPAQGDPPKR